MLNCRDVGTNATEFLSGALPIKTNLLVTWHVVRCANCRRAVIQIITMLIALRKREAKPVSEEQVQAWLNALEEHNHTQH